MRFRFWQKPKIFRYLLTRVRILYQITDFANECLLSFLAEVFYLHVFFNFFINSCNFVSF